MPADLFSRAIVRLIVSTSPIFHSSLAKTILAEPFDVRDAAAMNKTLSTLPESFRRIDVLINNAGLALGAAPAPEASLDDWLKMIETNVTGLVALRGYCPNRTPTDPHVRPVL